MALRIEDYVRAFARVLESINTADVEHATSLLDRAYADDQTIYVIGNGQSAATASAFALDLTKQTVVSPPRRRFRVISLSDNLSAITAWANDVCYEAIFTEQLKSLARPGDVLLAISAGGNSPNVIDACRWMKQNRGVVLGLAGFDGGALRSLSDACVVIHSTDYGFIETGHVAILHYWVDLFRERLAE